MESRKLVLVAAVVLGVLAVPAVAWADGALPTLVVAFPGMVIMFIPIVVIEALVLVRMLDVGMRRGLVVATASNAVTTLIGVPLAGILAAALTMGVGALPVDWSTAPSWASSAFQTVLSAGWLTNPEHGTLQAEMATALLVLLVPYFLISWWVEYVVSARMLRDSDPHAINRAVLVGNVLSYALIAAVLVVARVWFRG